MLAALAAGTYPFEDFRTVLFGSQEMTGDFHHNLLTPNSLTDLLTEAGFVNVLVPVKGAGTTSVSNSKSSPSGLLPDELRRLEYASPGFRDHQH